LRWEWPGWEGNVSLQKLAAYLGLHDSTICVIAKRVDGESASKQPRSGPKPRVQLVLHVRDGRALTEGGGVELRSYLRCNLFCGIEVIEAAERLLVQAELGADTRDGLVLEPPIDKGSRLESDDPFVIYRYAPEGLRRLCHGRMCQEDDDPDGFLNRAHCDVRHVRYAIAGHRLNLTPHLVHRSTLGRLSIDSRFHRDGPDAWKKRIRFALCRIIADAKECGDTVCAREPSELLSFPDIATVYAKSREFAIRVADESIPRAIGRVLSEKKQTVVFAQLAARHEWEKGVNPAAAKKAHPLLKLFLQNIPSEPVCVEQIDRGVRLRLVECPGRTR
jgi:hypothetical protein